MGVNGVERTCQYLSALLGCIQPMGGNTLSHSFNRYYMKLGSYLPIVIVAALGLAGIFFVSFQQSNKASSTDNPGAESNDKPAQVTLIPGTNLNRVVLTEKAVQRLAIKTGQTRMALVPKSRAQRLTIPYAAVIYDADGGTWAYAQPEPLVYVRHRISVDSIDQDLAVLADGPPPGTEVVIVGAAELLGAEFGVGK